jgi:hypothetical protein
MSEGEKNPCASPKDTGRSPRFRWFIHSLRTFVVVLTVVACFLGYNFNWMLQRNDCFFHSFKRNGCGPTTALPGRAPWTIRLLGARGHESIGVAKNSAGDWSDAYFAVKAEVVRLFPEARVYVMSFDELQAMWEEMEKQRSQSSNGS